MPDNNLPITSAQLHHSRSWAPHLALLITQIIFATWPIVGKIVLLTLPSTGLVALRATGSAILLFALKSILGGPRVAREDYKRLAWYSALGVVLNQLMFVKGLEYTTAINAALFAITIPIFALLVSVASKTDKLTWRKALGVALAACGVLFLIDPTHGDVSGGTALGNFLMVANSLAYAAYIALSKDVFERYGAMVALAWIFLFGSLGTLPIGVWNLAQTPLAAISWTVWAMVFYVILATVGGYFLNGWALARVNPSTVAVYIYLQPIIAFAVAPWVLGEAITRRTVIASLLIFAGLGLVIKKGKRQK